MSTSLSSYRRAWPWLLLIPIFILLLIPGAEKFEGANVFEAFWNWAWDRHHNTLSWGIRSVMMLPFIYFAYRRNWHGIIVSLIAMATNFFWFPMPVEVDPGALAFLNAEKEWMTGTWHLGKLLLASTIPLGIALVGYAFWKRSLLAGLLLIDGIFLLKALVSVDMDESGWTLVPFLIVGVVIFNLAIFGVVRFVRNHRHDATMTSQTSAA